MKIGFIGAGKVGWSLGKYLSQTNDVIGYASRSLNSAREASAFVGDSTRAYESALDLCRDADMVFITVPDGSIATVWNELTSQPEATNALDETLVAHCSGALSSQVFSDAHAFGAFAYSIHPLFAVASKTETYKELHNALFTIEGDPDRIETVLSLIEKLGNPVQVIPSSAKVRYHAAAALVSNHVVGLYRIACEELVRCGFTPQSAEAALAPLFLGNAQHVAHDGVVASLTGPAERGDMATIEKHLATLDGRTKQVYELLNETLLEIAAEKHAQQ